MLIHTYNFATSFLNHQPVLKEVLAISEYSAQYDDELTFRKGDRMQVYKEGMLFCNLSPELADRCYSVCCIKPQLHASAVLCYELI